MKKYKNKRYTFLIIEGVTFIKQLQFAGNFALLFVEHFFYVVFVNRRYQFILPDGGDGLGGGLAGGLAGDGGNGGDGGDSGVGGDMVITK